MLSGLNPFNIIGHSRLWCQCTFVQFSIFLHRDPILLWRHFKPIPEALVPNTGLFLFSLAWELKGFLGKDTWKICTSKKKSIARRFLIKFACASSDLHHAMIWLKSLARQRLPQMGQFNLLAKDSVTAIQTLLWGSIFDIAKAVLQMTCQYRLKVKEHRLVEVSAWAVTIHFP